LWVDGSEDDDSVCSSRVHSAFRFYQPLGGATIKYLLLFIII